MIKTLTLDMVPLLMGIQKKLYENQKTQTTGLPDFEDQEAHMEASLQGLIERFDGFAFFKDDQLVSYMTGYAEVECMKGSQKGAYTPEYAHGLVSSEFLYTYNELMKSLWGVWGPLGIQNHGLSYLKSQDDVRDFCFDMSYGKIVEDAVIDLREWSYEAPEQSNLSIRLAEKKDLEQLWQWEFALTQSLKTSPIFRYAENPTLEEVAPFYKSAFLGKESVTLVAERGDELLGAVRGKIGETTNSEWVCHEKNIAIDFLWTEPEQRGLGIASKLLESFFKEAKSKRLWSCSVDYESHNTPAKIFWRNRLNVYSESVLRKIDDRIQNF